MTHRYGLCCHFQRWRWYPTFFPCGTIHDHFYNEVSWDEAHSFWRQICSSRFTVQAILSRDGEAIRFYHREVGTDKVISSPI